MGTPCSLLFLFGTWISLHSTSPSFSFHLHYSRAWTDLMSVSPVRLEASWREEACLFPHLEYTQQSRLDALFTEQRSRAASGPWWPSVVEGPSLHFCKEAGPTLAQWQDTPGTLRAQHRCCSTRSVMLAGDAGEDSPAGSWAGNRQEPVSPPRGNWHWQGDGRAPGTHPRGTPSNTPGECLLALAENYFICRCLNSMDISDYAKKLELLYLITAN